MILPHSVNHRSFFRQPNHPSQVEWTAENVLALQGDVDGAKDVDTTDFNFLASNFALDGYG